MLTYLQGNIRTNMSMAVNKTAQFSNNTPYTSKGLECYVDADYSGGWFQADATSDDYFMSRTVMVVMYANCPVFWCISLQTEISLSKAEA